IDEARHNGFPRFPVPIGEDQPTVAPGPETYSTRKAALEQALLASARIPLAILRAGAIYGAGSRHPREWFFVKRLLDGRTAVPLAFSGKSRFHVAGTANIASIALAAIEAGGIQVLNAADPDAPSVLEIGEAIARVYGSKMELLPFQGPPEGSPGGVGAHPWCIPDPIVLDVSKAQALGWKPGPDYAGSIGEACRSAEALHRAGIAFAPYIDALFDYAAEDAWLAGRAT
ncbi:MAG: NAD-dependent epimerase/dehydratase family protein, partial [Caulobacteraceae bacterium]